MDKVLGSTHGEPHRRPIESSAQHPNRPEALISGMTISIYLRAVAFRGSSCVQPFSVLDDRAALGLPQILHGINRRSFLSTPREVGRLGTVACAARSTPLTWTPLLPSTFLSFWITAEITTIHPALVCGASAAPDGTC